MMASCQEQDYLDLAIPPSNTEVKMVSEQFVVPTRTIGCLVTLGVHTRMLGLHTGINHNSQVVVLARALVFQSRSL